MSKRQMRLIGIDGIDADDSDGEDEVVLGHKARVIEHLFVAHTLQRPWNPVVSYEELAQTINALGVPICKTNKANFFYFSSVSAANAVWPKSVFEKGWTGLARIGDGRCFEFVRVSENQSTPFVKLIRPNEGTSSAPCEIQETDRVKRQDAMFCDFKREDEVRLLKVIEETGLIERHWSKFVKEPPNVKERWMRCMQSPMRKGAKGEVDSFYMGEYTYENEATENFLVMVEAKSKKNDLFLSQIFHHALLAFNLAEETECCDPETSRVYCVGIETIGPSQVYVLQFAPMTLEELVSQDVEGLTIETRAVWTFKPGICGIGGYGMNHEKASTPDDRQGSMF
jgi:hypothetical protein